MIYVYIESVLLYSSFSHIPSNFHLLIICSASIMKSSQRKPSPEISCRYLLKHAYLFIQKVVHSCVIMVIAFQGHFQLFQRDNSIMQSIENHPPSSIILSLLFRIPILLWFITFNCISIRKTFLIHKLFKCQTLESNSDVTNQFLYSMCKVCQKHIFFFIK